MMEALVSDGVRLAYRVLGQGSREVLCVHGWMMSGAVFDDLLAALDLTDLRVVVPDLRGAGGSDRPATGYTLARFAEDLWTVADAAGLVRPVVVGHSMGGQLAQLLAAERPDRVAGLVLVNPVPASGLPLPDEARAVFEASADDPEMRGVILDIACKELSPAARARLLAVASDVAPACIAGALEAWTSGGFEGRLLQITAPALVIASDDDFLPAAFLESAVVAPLGEASLAHVPGPGHYPLVERPAEVAGLVASFLAETLRAPTALEVP